MKKLRTVLVWLGLAVLTIGVGDVEAARRALLVGVDSYRNLPYDSPRLGRRMPNLKGAVNDVRDFADSLVAHFAFRREEIETLTNENATRDNVLSAFRDWLIRGTREGDVVVFFFSGHGTQVPDENGDEDDGLDEALAPYDLVPSATTVKQSRLILDDELGALVGELGGRSLAFIVDACHSGTITRSIGSEVVRALEPTPGSGSAKLVWLDNLFATRGPNRALKESGPTWEGAGEHVVMTSSRPNQASIEVVTPTGAFHGAFTAALLEAMSTLSRPSYRDLYTYARRVMRDRYRLAQDPEMESARARLLDLPAFASFPDAPTPAEVRTEPKPPVERPSASASSGSSTIRDRRQTPLSTPGTGTNAPRPVQGSLRQLGPSAVDANVLLRIDPLDGADPSVAVALRERLGSLPYVRIADGSYFDRLIRGRVSAAGVYDLRLLNAAGDATALGPAASAMDVLGLAAPHLEYAYVFKRLADLRPGSPTFRVNVSVSEDRRDFRLGEKLVFDIVSEQDCYVFLFNLDSTASLHLIFPNQYSRENFIRAGAHVELPNESMRRSRFELEFLPPAGEETFKLIASNQPIEWSATGAGGRELEPAGGRPLALSSPVRDMVDTIAARIAEKARLPGFRWSEETIVLRSHAR